MRRARDPLKTGLIEKKESRVVKIERRTPAPRSLPPRAPDIDIKDASDVAVLSDALIEMRCMGLKLSVRILAEAPA